MSTRLIHLKSLFRNSNFKFRANLSTTKPLNATVALVGSAGAIGQPLSLLLKHNPKITNLCLYDKADVAGQILDLSHIDTRTNVLPQVNGDLLECVENADIVVVAAGLPRKPGMTRDDLLEKNAAVIYEVLLAIHKVGTSPMLAIITNPINSIIPFAHRLLLSEKSPLLTKQEDGKQSAKADRLFGISTLDCVRASTFYAEFLNKNPAEIVVPVVGGHSDTTMVPLFSMSNEPLEDEEIASMLTQKIREAGTKVVEAKQGKGSASLSMAFAANRFVDSLLEAHNGSNDIQCVYIPSKTHPELSFFAEMAHIHNGGVLKVLPFENITPYEERLLTEIVKPLKADIDKGIALADKYINKLFPDLPPSEASRIA